MEGGWWDQIFHASNQAQMDVIIDFYIVGIDYARSLRPDARFGYWGLPMKHQTAEDYTGPTLRRLLLAQGAVFPDTYEWNPGGNDYSRLRRHVEGTIRLVAGTVPVYVQMSPRWKITNSDCLSGSAECMPSHCGLHSNEEILRDQARAILDAEWTAPDGTVCRAAGLALWDAYVYEKYCYQDPSCMATCAATCDDTGSCDGGCSCGDGVACNSHASCVDLEYTCGDVCAGSCGDCTGKTICIDGVCRSSWWRWDSLRDSDVAAVWSVLDSKHLSIYQELTCLVDLYQSDPSGSDSCPEDDGL
jgi:hypothetical protein